MAEDADSTIVLNVPHGGHSRNSARGFALDQFARRHGYSSFAEWTINCFDQELEISGDVRENDSIDVADDDGSAGEFSTTFGYQVVLRLRRIKDGT